MDSSVLLGLTPTLSGTEIGSLISKSLLYPFQHMQTPIIGILPIGVPPLGDEVQVEIQKSCTLKFCCQPPPPPVNFEMENLLTI